MHLVFLEFALVIGVIVPEAFCYGITVTTNCYGTIRSSSRRITSPLYPSSYRNYENCYWLLTTAAEAITISFEDFFLENTYDYVRVYDGAGSAYNGTSLIGEFTGQPNPSSLSSSSNHMYITFTTDGSVTYRGFSLRYESLGDFQGNIFCTASRMGIKLSRQHFSQIHWENLHLKDPACRATVTPTAFVLSTSLSGCGTTHKESNDTLEFENMVINNQSNYNKSSVITRDSTIVKPFSCKYPKRHLVSTSYNASKEKVVASEANIGNFSIIMQMCKSVWCQSMYSQDDYPLLVEIGQQLWIQFRVETYGNLVIFAENCHSTASTIPHSSPKYEFLRNGCALDNTMFYNYDTTSSVQKFSIDAFRFLGVSSNVVYLHCELIVCHRNSPDSRCSRGCVASRRRRRDVGEYKDTSKGYDLSTGPFIGKKPVGTSKTDESKGSEENAPWMAIGFGVCGGILLVIVVAVTLRFIRRKVLKRRSASAHAVKGGDHPVAANVNSGYEG